MEYYTAIKKNEIMPFAATWMDLEIVILSEASQTQKEKYRMMSLTCGIFKKLIQMNLLTKQKQTHRGRKQTWLPRGRVGGGIVREFGIDMYTLLYLKWITNKDLLYSTGNSAQYYETT